MSSRARSSSQARKRDDPHESLAQRSPQRRASPSRRKKPKKGASPWLLLPWVLILAMAGVAMMEGDNVVGSWLAMLWSPWWLVIPLPWLLGALLLRRWPAAAWHLAIAFAISLGFGWLQFPRPLRPLPGEQSFTLATYNVKGCAVSDCYRVGTELLKADADVALLQEVFGYDVRPGLERTMKGWTFVGSGNRIIATRFPVLSWTSDSLIPEDPWGYTKALIKTPSGEVTFITIHQPTYNLRTAASRGPQVLLNYPQRVAVNQKKLTRALVRLVEQEQMTRPVVVGGDFNSPAVGSDHLAILGVGQDAFAEAGFGWNLTFPAPFPVIGIDRIIVDRRLAIGSARVVRTQASDHRPLVAVIGKPRG